MVALSLFVFAFFTDLVSSEGGGTIIAFGDSGDRIAYTKLVYLNFFLKKNLRPKNYLDFVCLLGDNFYPNGIDPVFGLRDPQFRLFTDVLARDIRNNFYVTAGNHDHLRPGSIGFQVEYASVDNRWFMGGSWMSMALKSPSNATIRPVCISQIDSSIDWTKGGGLETFEESLI
jgi:hypothetical protein